MAKADRIPTPGLPLEHELIEAWRVLDEDTRLVVVQVVQNARKAQFERKRMVDDVLAKLMYGGK